MGDKVMLQVPCELCKWFNTADSQCNASEGEFGECPKVDITLEVNGARFDELKKARHFERMKKRALIKELRVTHKRETRARLKEINRTLDYLTKRGKQI